MRDGVTASLQTGSRGHANAAASITALKVDAARGQSVKMRCANFRMTLATKVIPDKLVGLNEND